VAGRRASHWGGGRGGTAGKSSGGECGGTTGKSSKGERGAAAGLLLRGAAALGVRACPGAGRVLGLLGRHLGRGVEGQLENLLRVSLELVVIGGICYKERQCIRVAGRAWTAKNSPGRARMKEYTSGSCEAPGSCTFDALETVLFDWRSTVLFVLGQILISFSPRNVRIQAILTRSVIVSRTGTGIF